MDLLAEPGNLGADVAERSVACMACTVFTRDGKVGEEFVLMAPLTTDGIVPEAVELVDMRRIFT